MHSDIKRGFAMLLSAHQFGKDHPLIPPNALADSLIGELATAIEAIRTMGATQDGSRSQFLGRSSERRQVAERMRRSMRQIARVGKVLKAAEYPGVRQKLQVPRSNGYHPLLMRAELFLETVGPIRSAFIDRGMPADFEDRLRGMIAQFQVATGRRNTALSSQVGSTAGMKARLRDAVLVVRELDVILRLRLEESDPALYAAWKSASHIQRAPKRGEKEEAAASSAPEQNGNLQFTEAETGGNQAASQVPEETTGPPEGI